MKNNITLDLDILDVSHSYTNRSEIEIHITLKENILGSFCPETPAHSIVEGTVFDEVIVCNCILKSNGGFSSVNL